MAEWLDYEKMISQIYETISPDASVLHDDHIYGQDSHIERQIDVSIRFKKSGCSFLIVVQAKNYSKPADVNVVGEFATVVKDVRASKGVLICNSGFTKSAKQMASSLGIDLCSAHDAETKEWKTVLTIPVVWEQFIPLLNFNLIAYFHKGDSINKDIRKWVISNDEGKTKLDLLGSFISKWNNNEIPKDPDKTYTLRQTGRNFKILAGKDIWREVNDLTCRYLVQRKIYRKDVETEEFTGLQNYLTKEIEIVKLGVSIPSLDPSNGWLALEQNIEELANKENILITVSSPVIQMDSFETDFFSGQLIE